MGKHIRWWQCEKRAGKAGADIAACHRGLTDQNVHVWGAKGQHHSSHPVTQARESEAKPQTTQVAW